jgi:DnaJ-domain-containing protein 1
MVLAVKTRAVCAIASAKNTATIVMATGINNKKSLYSGAIRPAFCYYAQSGLCVSGQNMINHFRVLGVKASASEDDIKKAYKRLSNKYHPDKLLGLSADEKDAAAAQLQLVKQAYEVLSDPKQKAAFIKDFNNVIVTDPTAAMKELWDQYY